MNAVQPARPATPAPRRTRSLPPWRRVLAIVAHPDDESFGLGALLHAFTSAGAAAHVLVFSHGEASTLGQGRYDLHAQRATELHHAAAVLGLSGTTLLNHPDGGLAAVPRHRAVADVAAVAQLVQPDGLLVFDETGVTGHPDHIAATRAALAFAEIVDLPVLGWTIPAQVAEAVNREYPAGLAGRLPEDIGLCVRVDRTVHRAAARAHVSQADSPVLWLRLQLLGQCEHVVWLRR